MDRLRSAVVVIASAVGFLGLGLLGDAESSARAHPLRAARSAAPVVELASDEAAGCSAAARRREPGAFCSIDSGPAHPRALRSGGATR